MTREDGKRNFVLREGDEETSIFSGTFPRQAALKAARRLDPAPSEDAASPETIKLREKGTDRVHVYEAKAWEEPAPEDGPDWLGDTVTQSIVSKEAVEHLDD